MAAGRVSRWDGMFWRPTSLFLRLICALWLLLLGAAVREGRRSWTWAGALLRLPDGWLGRVVACEDRVVWEGRATGWLLWLRVWPEGRTVRFCGAAVLLLRLGVLLRPVETLEEDRVCTFSFLVALPELPPPVRRFWLCASKGVVHIIAMQSISTTQVIFFIILKC